MSTARQMLRRDAGMWSRQIQARGDAASLPHQKRSRLRETRGHFLPRRCAIPLDGMLQ